MKRNGLLWTLIILVLVALVISGVAPFDRLTWFLEVVPILIAAPILFATYRRFPITSFLYVVIAVHALVLIAGGAYTYARVPLGFWIQHVLDLNRNPYDKIGHFMQGLTPALLARELFIRGRYVSGRKMTAFLAICVALAISLCYELFEWGSAVALGQGADEFLGTQGDPWDTQSDMFLALIGATVAMLAFARFHDRQIKALQASQPPGAPEKGGT